MNFLAEVWVIFSWSSDKPEEIIMLVSRKVIIEKEFIIEKKRYVTI